jgi:hypothetical protein
MITRNPNQKVRFFESLIFFSDVKLQWRRPEHDAPAIHDDADRPDDPDLAGHHHPDHRSPHVRRHVSSGLRLNAPSQLRINVASGLQRRRHRQHDSAGQHRAGVPLRPSRHDISAHLQMTEPPQLYAAVLFRSFVVRPRSGWQKDTRDAVLNRTRGCSISVLCAPTPGASRAANLFSVVRMRLLAPPHSCSRSIRCLYWRLYSCST